MFEISIALFLIFAAIGFFANRARKRRMSVALGREVKQHEMTSLNSWMDVAEAENNSSKKNLWV